MNQFTDDFPTLLGFSVVYASAYGHDISSLKVWSILYEIEPLF